jgi:hypothetical protein
MGVTSRWGKQSTFSLSEPGLLNWKIYKKSTVCPNSLKGKGVPIGNLTSQLFANFYLGSG